MALNNVTCAKCGADIVLDVVKSAGDNEPEILHGKCQSCGQVHEKIRFAGRALRGRERGPQ